MRAFLLGLLAAALLVYAAGAALAVAADVHGWGGLDLRLGPLVLVELERTEAGTEWTLGSGLVLLCALAGLVNSLAAGVLRRRAERRSHRVHSAR